MFQTLCEDKLSGVIYLRFLASMCNLSVKDFTPLMQVKFSGVTLCRSRYVDWVRYVTRAGWFGTAEINPPRTLVSCSLFVLVEVPRLQPLRPGAAPKACQNRYPRTHQQTITKPLVMLLTWQTLFTSFVNGLKTSTQTYKSFASTVHRGQSVILGWNF